MGALAIIGLMIGPIGVNYAQAALPSEIHAALVEAALESNEALLAAVAAAVEQNPELAQAIIDLATRLNPNLKDEIVAVTTVPAAGPAFPILGALLGAGAAGGAAAALGGGSGGGDGAPAAVGGGDGAPPPPPGDGAPPPPPALTPGDFETGEYNAQEGLGLINASDAYARGLTGEGVIVAVIDTGLDGTHPEFAGRIADGGFDFVQGCAYNEEECDVIDPDGHGTHVSGIIAANKDDIGMHGVAFDSTILPIRIFDDEGDFGLESVEDLAAAIDVALDGGAAVINNSWGSVTDVTESTRELIEAMFPEAIAAVQRAIDNSTIIVFAAGNEMSANPNIEAGLPFHFSEFQDLWVAVISVDLDGSLSLFSNRCGVTAEWCIAAPGRTIFSTASGGGYGVKSGTSMAAPHVSGALAVILQLFAGLTPEEAVVRLFVSANGTGIYADSSIFGQGLLDLEAATRPIGTVFVLTGDSLSGPAFALTNTRVNLGGAFGDGLRNSLQGVTLAVFDSYNAPFYLDLGSLVNVAGGRIDIDRLLQRFGKFSNRQTVAYGSSGLSYAFSSSGQAGDEALAPGLKPKTELAELSFTQRLGRTSELTFNYNTHPAYAFGLHESGTVDRTMMVSTDAFAAPYLSFGERGYNFAAATELAGFATVRLGSFFGTAEGKDTATSFGTTAELALSVGERANLAFQLGMMSESETFLGSETEGAFDLEGGVPTHFTGVSGEFALTDTWRLVGSAYAGLSYPEATANSLFADVSPILTQSFTAGIVGDGVFRDDDLFGLLVNQPLRVTSGSAELAFATGRDQSRNLLIETFTADLAPDGREVDLEAFYSLALAEQTTLATSAMLRLEPGHIEGASPEGIFMLRFEHKL